MSKKNVVVFLGSPRKDANSTILARRIAEGARQAGANVEEFYLHDMEIAPCDACDSCQGMLEIDCVIEDDMVDIYPKIRNAESIVFASPVYWGSVSAQLKLALDRCYGLEQQDSPSGHVFDGKKIGIALTYAGVDLYDSGGINCIRMFEDSFRYHPAEIVGIVHGVCDKPGEISANADVLTSSFELGKALAAE